MNSPIIVIILLLNWFSYITRVYFQNNIFNSLQYVLRNPDILLQGFPLSLHSTDISISAAFGGILILLIVEKRANRKKFRKGVEHGSAMWGKPKDINPFMDTEDPRNNIILSQTEKLRLNGRPSNFKYDRNKNVVVIGGSGSGKTRFFIKPNLMQMNSTYIVTDPKGTILNEVGMMLFKMGYKIKVLNLIEFAKSMRYNPFAYIKKEQDILKVVETIIKNTNGKKPSGGDDFWEKAEKLLYQALIAMIHFEFPKEERNLPTLVTLISKMEVREDDENFKNAIDLLFDDLEEEKPECFAVKQYKAYKLAAGKTAKSILISCSSRLAPFNIPALSDLMSTDELELDKLGTEKTALFVIIPDTDATFNFVVSMMYTQLFNILCIIADNEYGGKLPIHVRCLLDEFANIGEIPDFDKLIATIRSRNISASIILQAISQLKNIYKDNADTIIGNCDTTIFLGGKEKSTLKEMSEVLGKETINDYNTSDTRGNSPSKGMNYSKIGRELMSVDELQRMDGSECIVMVRGLSPYKSKKYDITKHPMYKWHADNKESNTWFSVEKYIASLPGHRKNQVSHKKMNDILSKKWSKDEICICTNDEMIDIEKEGDEING